MPFPKKAAKGKAKSAVKGAAKAAPKGKSAKASPFGGAKDGGKAARNKRVEAMEM